jgi:hypothetical protein
MRLNGIISRLREGFARLAGKVSSLDRKRRSALMVVLSSALCICLCLSILIIFLADPALKGSIPVNTGNTGNSSTTGSTEIDSESSTNEEIGGTSTSNSIRNTSRTTSKKTGQTLSNPPKQGLVYVDQSMTPAPLNVPERKKDPGMRLYVDNQNPLFMFGISVVDKVNPKSEANRKAVRERWYSIPEDIRKYSCFYIWADAWRTSTAQMRNEIEGLMEECEKLKIPFFVMIEYYHNALGEANYSPPLTQSETDGFYEDYKYFIGMVHTELGATTLKDDEIARMKVSLKSAIKYGGIMIWQEVENYLSPACIIDGLNRDAEFYNLCSQNPQNVIFQAKENGFGRKYSLISSPYGAWLSGCCGNWGINLENYLWYEEAYGKYGELGGDWRSGPIDMIYYYPLPLNIMSVYTTVMGGGTVFCSHEVAGMYQTNMNTMTPAFYDMLYPVYQQILRDKIIPTREQLRSDTKVAYQIANASSEPAIAGREAALLVDLYGPTTEWLDMLTSRGITKVTKKWLMSTGRYGIVPFLPKRVNAASVLPGATIINSDNYNQYDTKAEKLNLFNSKYPQRYTGTSFMHADTRLKRWTFFNPNENQLVTTFSEFSMQLKPEVKARLEIDQWTCGTIAETDKGFQMEIFNMTYDVSLMDANLAAGKTHVVNQFLARKNLSTDKVYKNLTLKLSGLKAEPKVVVNGDNNCKASMTYSNGTATITIRSNGRVLVNLTY